MPFLQQCLELPSATDRVGEDPSNGLKSDHNSLWLPGGYINPKYFKSFQFDSRFYHIHIYYDEILPIHWFLNPNYKYKIYHKPIRFPVGIKGLM